jgi:hypothetical protein
MAAFLVTSLVPNPALSNNIAGAYPNAYLTISQTAWLVGDTGVTTKDVCEKIGVREGGISGVITVKIESYFGFAPPNIWEWLKVRVIEP